MAGEQLLNVPNVEPQTDDFILSPQGNTNGAASHIEAKMSAVVYDRPHDEFTLLGGKVLYIYSKPEGQLREIDMALQEWLDAERRGDKRINKRWRFWRRRRLKVHRTLTDIQAAKYAFFCAVFADPYNPDKHQEIGRDEFMAMPLDMQTAIMAAHREANDATDLLSAILGRDVGNGKKKMIQPPNG